MRHSTEYSSEAVITQLTRNAALLHIIARNRPEGKALSFTPAIDELHQVLYKKLNDSGRTQAYSEACAASPNNPQPLKDFLSSNEDIGIYLFENLPLLKQKEQALASEAITTTLHSPRRPYSPEAVVDVLCVNAEYMMYAPGDIEQVTFKEMFAELHMFREVLNERLADEGKKEEFDKAWHDAERGERQKMTRFIQQNPSIGEYVHKSFPLLQKRIDVQQSIQLAYKIATMPLMLINQEVLHELIIERVLFPTNHAMTQDQRVANTGAQWAVSEFGYGLIEALRTDEIKYKYTSIKEALVESDPTLAVASKEFSQQRSKLQYPKEYKDNQLQIEAAIESSKKKYFSALKNFKFEEKDLSELVVFLKGNKAVREYLRTHIARLVPANNALEEYMDSVTYTPPPVQMRPKSSNSSLLDLESLVMNAMNESNAFLPGTLVDGRQPSLLQEPLDENEISTVIEQLKTLVQTNEGKVFITDVVRYPIEVEDFLQFAPMDLLCKDAIRKTLVEAGKLDFHADREFSTALNNILTDDRLMRVFLEKTPKLGRSLLQNIPLMKGVEISYYENSEDNILPFVLGGGGMIFPALDSSDKGYFTGIMQDNGDLPSYCAEDMANGVTNNIVASDYYKEVCLLLTHLAMEPERVKEWTNVLQACHAISNEDKATIEDVSLQLCQNAGTRGVFINAMQALFYHADEETIFQFLIENNNVAESLDSAFTLFESFAISYSRYASTEASPDTKVGEKVKGDGMMLKGDVTLNAGVRKK